MLNRVVLPVVIAGLILTFFVLEVSGRLPAFQAFAYICLHGDAVAGVALARANESLPTTAPHANPGEAA